MTILAGLRTLLLAESSITTLVGSQAIGGVTYPGIFVGTAVQGFSQDHIVIVRTSLDPMKTLTSTTGMRSTDIDIECYARSKARLELITEAVSAYIKDYSGAAGGSDTIDAVLWNDQYDTQAAPIDGTDNWLNSATIDLTIQHTPS